MEYISKGKNIPEKLIDDKIVRQTNKDGNNLVMIWLMSSDKDVPEYLKYKGFQKHTNRLKQIPIYYWIMNRPRQEIPDWIKYPGCERHIDSEGWNMVMYWIYARYSPPDDWMYYPGCGKQVDKYSGRIPAMMWIDNIATPPVKQLDYPKLKDHKDIDGNNFMMYWLRTVSSDNPPCFVNGIFGKQVKTLKYVTPKLVNKFKQTPQIYWLVSRRKPLPKWLIYDGCEKHIDNEGDNLAMMWVQTVKTKPPKYLMYKGAEKQKNKKGKTLEQMMKKFK